MSDICIYERRTSVRNLTNLMWRIGLIKGNNVPKFDYFLYSHHKLCFY